MLKELALPYLQTHTLFSHLKNPSLNVLGRQVPDVLFLSMCHVKRLSFAVLCLWQYQRSNPSSAGFEPG
jgi:hypothetical protein